MPYDADDKRKGMVQSLARHKPYIMKLNSALKGRRLGYVKRRWKILSP
jgi:hypothetical protein